MTVFDTAPEPPTGPVDDPYNIVQSFKKLFLTPEPLMHFAPKCYMVLV